MKNLSKFIYSSFFLLFLLSFFPLGFVFAQIPPNISSCTDTGDPEFHSLRPYQASPCQTEMASTAKFCGNELTFHDTITETYPGGGNCVESGGKITCTYNEIVNKNLTIDLSEAELPIIGNTENVPNSQPSTGTSLTDEDKMNEYVSWYLGGVINKAESPPLDVGKKCVGETTQRRGTCLNTIGQLCFVPNPIPGQPEIPFPLVVADGTDSCVSKTCCVSINPLAEKVNIYDRNKLINYSGPINKLLPRQILEAQRIKTINNVDDVNHDQIVVCAESNIPFGNLLDIGRFTPVECYKGNNSEAQGQVFRLKADGLLDDFPILSNLVGYYGWDGSLSWTRDIANIIPGSIKYILDTFIDIFPPVIPMGTIQLTIESSFLTAWNKKTPPLPWSDENGEPFLSDTLYQKAYNEWRGRSCFIVPVLNYLACFDNIFIPNKYADLYPYVPLSSTEDLMGSVSIDNVGSATNKAADGITVNGVTFSNQTPSTLFFPHMQESTELASILQDTYVSSEEQENKKGPPTNVSAPASCTTVDVRTNMGDSLFATSIEGNLHYEASFSCEFKPTCSGSPSSSAGDFCRSEIGGECVPNNWSCTSEFGQRDCIDSNYKCGIGCACVITPQTCTKDVYISLSTTSGTPNVDDVWSQLVAGPQSIFKRIFPQTNTPNGLEQIKDIPGSTNITYSGDGISQSGTVLKIPHVGGISEYFLKGIQTALRPKGYGEAISTTYQSYPITGSCAPGSGPCAVDNLLPYFGNDTDKATKASIICNKESGSNPMAKNDGCLTGRFCDYSIGLFQVNMLAHCPGAFSSYSCSGTISCTIGNQATLQSCETRLLNPIENIKEAVRISSNGTNWTPWSAATVCGIR